MGVTRPDGESSKHVREGAAEAYCEGIRRDSEVRKPGVGYTQVNCDTSHKSCPVASSCKGPLCLSRTNRRTWKASFQWDERLPEADFRMWTLSLPRVLRLPLVRREELLFSSLKTLLIPLRKINRQKSSTSRPLPHWPVLSDRRGECGLPYKAGSGVGMGDRGGSGRAEGRSELLPGLPSETRQWPAAHAVGASLPCRSFDLI